MNWFIIIGLIGILLPSIGYPILMGIFSSLKQFFAAKGVNSEIKSDSALPFVSFILCAYNEEAVLRAKLENTLSLQYPSEKLDVLVLSDSSSDQTDQISLEFSDRGIRLLRCESRIGKSENLSRFVP